MLNAIIGLYLLMLSLYGPGTVAEATWVHNSLDGNVQRDGTIYHADDPQNIAVGVDYYGRPLIPLGTWLVVCTSGDDWNSCALGEIRDTGYLGGNLDLSPAMFERLGVLGAGRIRIEYWRLEGKDE